MMEESMMEESMPEEEVQRHIRGLDRYVLSSEERRYLIDNIRIGNRVPIPRTGYNLKGEDLTLKYHNRAHDEDGHYKNPFMPPSHS